MKSPLTNSLHKQLKNHRTPIENNLNCEINTYK